MLRFSTVLWLCACDGGFGNKEPQLHPVPVAQDEDSDGWTAAKDCDDGDSARGGAEVPYDGIDNDCDVATADDDLDSDGRLLAEDCDDTDAGVGGPEVVGDNIDNDCDSTVDCDDTDIAGLDGVWEGDLTASAGAGFCDGYCTRSVTGDLVISGSGLRDLDGLACLTSIGGDLVLYHNIALETLSGLERLATVPGDLFIAGNTALTSLSGLENLTTVGKHLTIGYNNDEDAPYYYYSNASLTSLVGLSGLATIGGNLSIYSNEALTSLSGLDSLSVVGGDLRIGYSYDDDDYGGNDALTSLDGLETLVSIGGELFIGYNKPLVDVLALYNLTSVTDVSILYNPVLTDTAAQALVDEIDSIAGRVTITGN